MRYNIIGKWMWGNVSAPGVGMCMAKNGIILTCCVVTHGSLTCQMMQQNPSGPRMILVINFFYHQQEIPLCEICIHKCSVVRHGHYLHHIVSTRWCIYLPTTWFLWESRTPRAFMEKLAWEFGNRDLIKLSRQSTHRAPLDPIAQPVTRPVCLYVWAWLDCDWVAVLQLKFKEEITTWSWLAFVLCRWQSDIQEWWTRA